MGAQSSIVPSFVVGDSIDRTCTEDSLQRHFLRMIILWAYRIQIAGAEFEKFKIKTY